MVKEAKKSHDGRPNWQVSTAGVVNSAQVWGLESQESRWCESQSEFEGPGTRKRWRPRAAEGGRQGSSKELPFALSPACGSPQALNGRDGAHPHWWGPSFLFSLLIQISCRNTDTPRHVLAINHHIWLLRACGVQSLVLKVDERHSMPAHPCERAKAMPTRGLGGAPWTSGETGTSLDTEWDAPALDSAPGTQSSTNLISFSFF